MSDDESKQLDFLPAHDGEAKMTDPEPPPVPEHYEFFAHAVKQIVAVRDSMTGEGGAITLLNRSLDKSVDGLRKDISRLHGDFTGLHALASKTKLANDANWESLKHELTNLKSTVANLAISVTAFDRKIETIRAEVKEEIAAVRQEIATVRGSVAGLSQRVDMLESGEAIVR
jgi:chromosome segregation ATPase